jgi:peptidoglycan/LPS O-acetylase OafA/YrhL
MPIDVADACAANPATDVTPVTPPPKQHHVPFLDALRGLAILAVFVYHALGSAYGWESVHGWRGLFRDFDRPLSLLLLYPFTYGGVLGVAAFFVISGFCIHISAINSRQKGWKAFFWRRFFRIYPAYLLCLLGFFFLWPWYHYSLDSPGNRANLLSHLFSYHNLFVNTKFGINPSFWSIAVEIQLYLIYPLLVGVTMLCGWRRSLLLLLGMELSIRLMGFFIPETVVPYYFISNSPLGFWFSWSIGAYLAECRQRGRRDVLGWISIPLVVVLALVLPHFRPTTSLDFPLFALLTALVVDRLLRVESWTAPQQGWPALLWKHLSFLGVVSFSFYLIHQPFLEVFKSYSGALATRWGVPVASPLGVFLVSLFLLYPLILLISWALYRWVEKPFIRLGQRLWSRWA